MNLYCREPNIVQTFQIQIYRICKIESYKGKAQEKKLQRSLSNITRHPREESRRRTILGLRFDKAFFNVVLGSKEIFDKCIAIGFSVGFDVPYGNNPTA